MDNPTGWRVPSNVQHLRKARGLTLAELAERVTALGHPMTLNTLSKIENHGRRVDVDDLVALALALDVSPNRLLLWEAADDRDIDLVTSVTSTSRDAWRWACGESPLGLVDADGVFDAGRLDRFTEENRPHDPVGKVSDSLLQQHGEDFAAAVGAVQRLRDQDIPMGAIVIIVNAMEIIGRERERREASS